MGFFANPVKSIEGTLRDPGKTISHGLDDVNKAVSSAGTSITHMLSNPKTLAMLAMNYFMPGSGTALEGLDAAEMALDAADVADTSASALDTLSEFGDTATTDFGGYDSSGFGDPSQAPYDPGGMSDVNIPDLTKSAKIPSAITSSIRNLVSSSLLSPQGTRSGGKSALCSSSGLDGMTIPSFLCGKAEFMKTKSAPKCVGGLADLKQIGNPLSASARPYCEYSIQDQANMMGQAPVGSSLGYANGGVAHLKEGQQPSNEQGPGLSLSTILREAFCEKNLKPVFVCDAPTLLSYQSSGAKPAALSALNQMRPAIAGGYAKGGLPEKYHAAAPEGHHPEFITGVTGYYACGGGTGQSDDIPAMLHDGDYVMDAETVSALGDGSSKAGRHVLDGFRSQVPHKAGAGGNPVPAKIADGEYVFPASFVTALGGGDNKRGAEILDGLRTKLRAHKRGAPLDKIPPKAKDPIDYIKKAKV